MSWQYAKHSCFRYLACCGYRSSESWSLMPILMSLKHDKTSTHNTKTSNINAFLSDRYLLALYENKHQSPRNALDWLIFPTTLGQGTAFQHDWRYLRIIRQHCNIIVVMIQSLAGWWFGSFFIFPFSWECHHPNWRSHIFQRDWNHQPDRISN